MNVPECASAHGRLQGNIVVSRVVGQEMGRVVPGHLPAKLVSQHIVLIPAWGVRLMR